MLEGGKESRRWPCCPQMSPPIKAEVHSDCSGHYKTTQKHQAGPRPCCSAQLTTTQRAQPEIQPAKRRIHHGEVPELALSRGSTFPQPEICSCFCSWWCFCALCLIPAGNPWLETTVGWLERLLQWHYQPSGSLRNWKLSTASAPLVLLQKTSF